MSSLSPTQRRIVSLLAAVQLALFVAAQLDISRRPETGVNGSKRVWRLVCLANFIGPLSYFRWGRRRHYR